MSDAPQEIIQLNLTRDEFDSLSGAVCLAGHVLATGKPHLPSMILLAITGRDAYNSVVQKLKLACNSVLDEEESNARH